jgi:L-fuculose-phosphate aldolase
MKFEKERVETAAVMRRLYDRGLTTCSGGNVSVRIDENTVAITPSASDKSIVQAEDIALISLGGALITEDIKVSIETGMHLAVYRQRKDIGALVHAHPLHATLFTASHKKLRTDIIAEARFLLGEPQWAPYAIMGSETLAQIVAKAFSGKETGVVLMENHGVITAGDNLFRAYDRLEVLESAAKMTILGNDLGGMNYLSRERLKEIDELSS